MVSIDPNQINTARQALNLIKSGQNKYTPGAKNAAQQFLAQADNNGDTADGITTKEEAIRYINKVFYNDCDFSSDLIDWINAGPDDDITKTLLMLDLMSIFNNKDKKGNIIPADYYSLCRLLTTKYGWNSNAFMAFFPYAQFGKTGIDKSAFITLTTDYLKDFNEKYCKDKDYCRIFGLTVGKKLQTYSKIVFVEKDGSNYQKFASKIGSLQDAKDLPKEAAEINSKMNEYTNNLAPSKWSPGLMEQYLIQVANNLSKTHKDILKQNDKRLEINYPKLFDLFGWKEEEKKAEKKTDGGKHNLRHDTTSHKKGKDLRKNTDNVAGDSKSPQTDAQKKAAEEKAREERIKKLEKARQELAQKKQTK